MGPQDCKPTLQHELEQCLSDLPGYDLIQILQPKDFEGGYHRADPEAIE